MAKEYKERLRTRPFRPDLKLIEARKNKIFEMKLKLAETNCNKMWTLKDLEAALKDLKTNEDGSTKFHPYSDTFHIDFRYISYIFQIHFILISY